MKLYVIRHGRTDWNSRRIMQGRTDIPLNEDGIAQAREAKAEIDKYALDRVFVSPLRRARQTAEILLEGRNVPVIAADALMERSYGIYEGKSSTSFDYVGFWDPARDLHYPQAESVSEFFARVWPFLDMLRERFPEERILLVTHGGVLRAVDCYFDRTKMTDMLGQTIPKNCSVKEYDT